MHLNDDVETGLTLPTEELVELPHVQSDTPPLTLQTAVPASTIIPESTPDIMPPTPPGQIPDLKAKFDLISDKAHHLVDLKEVESMLLDQKTISQESAQVVDDYFGGLFTPRLPKASFTVTPSLTNYSYVVRYAKEALESEVGKFVDQYKLSITELQALYTEFLEQYEDHWRQIESGRHEVHAHYEELIEQIQQCHDCVVPIHAESGETVDTQHPLFVNLLDYPIAQFNVNALRLLSSNKQGPFNDIAFYQGIHSIQHMLRSETLIHWIKMLTMSPTIMSRPLPDEVDVIQLRDQGKELCLREILRFYNDDTELSALRDAVYGTLTDCLAVINQNVQAITDAAPEASYTTTQQQITANGTSSNNAIECLELASDGVHRLLELNQAILHVLHALVYFVPKVD
jgi:hypothetical protein